MEKKDSAYIWKILSERIRLSEEERVKKVQDATEDIVDMLANMAHTIDLDRRDCLRLQVSNSHVWWQKNIDSKDDIEAIIEELKERGFQARQTTEGLLEVWLTFNM